MTIDTPNVIFSGGAALLLQARTLHEDSIREQLAKEATDVSQLSTLALVREAAKKDED